MSEDTDEFLERVCAEAGKYEEMKKKWEANEALIEELVKALEFFSIPHKHCSCQTCIHTHALIAKARSRGGKVNE